MDLKTKKFNMRVLGVHYITKFINREYKPSTAEQRNYIRKEYLNKIYKSLHTYLYYSNFILNILKGNLFD